ncbi:MAG TPA: DUF975 family protein [Pontiella sp.]
MSERSGLGLLGDAEDVKNRPGLGAERGLSNAQLMADARMALSGNWGMAVLGNVLYTLLIMSFSIFVGVAGLVVGVAGGASGADIELAGGIVQIIANLGQLIIYGAVIVGFMGFFLGIAQEGDARLELLFVGFRRFWKSFGVYFFYTLFVYLWTSLFIIPGIIAAYRYMMAFFIIADDEDCGALEAISRSKAMMVGNKWKFFCLQWRFLGWGILCVMTFGIGFLWVIPYMQTSFAKFYEDVK